jgi:hypothetical protein
MQVVFFFLDSMPTLGVCKISDPIYTRVLVPLIKRQELKTRHSSSSTKVKNGEAKPPLPHTSLWCCKYRNKFTFKATETAVRIAVPTCPVTPLNAVPKQLTILVMYIMSRVTLLCHDKKLKRSVAILLTVPGFLLLH